MTREADLLLGILDIFGALGRLRGELTGSRCSRYAVGNDGDSPLRLRGRCGSPARRMAAIRL
jgi:hypothetical protein